MTGESPKAEAPQSEPRTLDPDSTPGPEMRGVRRGTYDPDAVLPAGLAAIIIFGVHYGINGVLPSSQSDVTVWMLWAFPPVVLLAYGLFAGDSVMIWRRGSRLASVAPRERRWIFASLLLVLASLTMAFAVMSALLWDADVLTRETQSAVAVTPYDELEDPVLELDYYYVWHLLDAVPVLKVPATLNWEEPLEFADNTSGVLLLLYKLLVIFPIIGAIAALLRWREVEPGPIHAER